MEQKLKSVVDDEHFHGKKIDRRKTKIRSNPSRYLACPHSVLFLSYSRIYSHKITYLGFEIDSVGITVTLTTDRKQKIVDTVTRLLDKGSATVR